MRRCVDVTDSGCDDVTDSGCDELQSGVQFGLFCGAAVLRAAAALCCFVQCYYGMYACSCARLKDLKIQLQMTAAKFSLQV